MDNLPETMYDYRSEREAEDSCFCEICDATITESEYEDHDCMCDFCYRNQPTTDCINCDERISQYRKDNLDGLCEDCEEKQSN